MDMDGGGGTPQQPLPQQRYSLGSAAGGDATEQVLFNMKLEIQQLKVCGGVRALSVVSPVVPRQARSPESQEKAAFLAGGTDAEQLADLLMEKEDEVKSLESAREGLLADLSAANAREEVLQVSKGRTHVRLN